MVFFMETPMTNTTRDMPATLTLDRGEGDAFWFLDTRSTIKAGRADGAQFSMLEYEMPAGHETPFHRHQEEDEGIYVLEGTISVFLDSGRVVQAGPGSYIHVGCGTAHGLRATTAGRLLVVTGRAQFGEFVRGMGEPTTSEELPIAGPPDMEKMSALAVKHGIEVLGPLPS
jgi:quercetin dioxygenase-like cupin family protein